MCYAKDAHEMFLKNCLVPIDSAMLRMFWMSRSITTHSIMRKNAINGIQRQKKNMAITVTNGMTKYKYCVGPQMTKSLTSVTGNSGNTMVLTN